MSQFRTFRRWKLAVVAALALAAGGCAEPGVTAHRAALEDEPTLPAPAPADPATDPDAGVAPAPIEADAGAPADPAAACAACQTALCADRGGCEGLEGLRRSACEALLVCASLSKCAATSPEACYCGAADPLGCLVGNANGICRAAVEVAAESVVPTTIAERFLDPGFPSGRANDRLACTQELCADVCR